MTGEDGHDSSAPTLVLYDGVCALCNRVVGFLLRHDRHDRFRFAPLQSEFAQNLSQRHGLNAQDLDTIVVIPDFGQPNERVLDRSEAALWSVGQLGRPWRFLAIARLIPRSIREAAYRFIARRRYRMFGKYDACPIPRPEDRHKFLAG
jgi:predicted DCC family thiol-disulfide oxidoreductase YuxK